MAHVFVVFLHGLLQVFFARKLDEGFPGWTPVAGKRQVDTIFTTSDFGFAEKFDDFIRSSGEGKPPHANHRSFAHLRLIPVNF